MNKLTLCFICQNGDYQELLTIEPMLDSVSEYVDEICVTVTDEEDNPTINAELLAILEHYSCNISTFKWVNDFSKARNFNFNQATNDFVLWLDTDDVLVGAENLKDAMTMFDKNTFLNELWMDYHYDHDVDGNILSNFPRERIVKKGVHSWKGRLHENSVCKYMPVGRHLENIHVSHNTDHANIEEKSNRNLAIIKDAYDFEIEHGILDARTVYDLARCYHSRGDLQEAHDSFKEFLKATSSEADYYDALMRLGDIYILSGNTQSAVEVAHLAMETKYDWPDAYILLATVATSEEMYEKALSWLEVAKTKDPPTNSGLPLDPTKYTVKPMYLEQICLFMTNQADKSLEVIDAALKITPSDKKLHKARQRNIDFQNQMCVEKGFLQAIDFLKLHNEHDKLPVLLDALPNALKDLPQFVRLRDDLTPVSGKDRLVVYCHESFEVWDGNSYKDGIGGSEEAVINISKHLVELGWKVEVYNECLTPKERLDGITEKVIDGVIYRPYTAYNPTVPCDVFVAWRLPEFLVFAPEESYKIVWLHDIQDSTYYHEKILDKIDKVFCMSKFHKTYIEGIVPEDKIYVTRNGIDPSHFTKKIKDKNNNHRYIYASSPDRGLEYILSNWEAIREVDPKAELNIFYGFTKVYDKLIDDDPGRREFKERIMGLIHKLRDKGVTYIGRIGHQELASEYLRSGWWLYPCDFPEIFCISAVKAQAAGCWPICTGGFALDEVVKYGEITKGDIKKADVQKLWVNSINTARLNVTNVMRNKAAKWAKNKYSWKSLAKDWSDKIKGWRAKNEYTQTK